MIEVREGMFGDESACLGACPRSHGLLLETLSPSLGVFAVIGDLYPAESREMV
jgi:hypothetical protein